MVSPNASLNKCPAKSQVGGSTSCCAFCLWRRPHDRTLDASLVVVVAAVRYGRHLPEAETFLALFNKNRSPPPLVLVSVNLTARKEGRQSATDNPYLRKAIDRHELAPVAAFAIAGRLNYPNYRWFDRQMIRLIMAMTGGPADGISTIEYTNWAQVNSVAGEIATLAESTTSHK
jgi:menaquinone-dependent protoporphyrinogen oxidase